MKTFKPWNPNITETLPVVTATSVADKARETVNKERKGEQHGLFTKFPTLNRSSGKYMRFANVNLWAGLSGSGKSYLLNILTQSFLDKELNKNSTIEPIVLNFSLEMSGETEVLRSCASDLGVSYTYLLSSEFDKKTNDYNTITEEEYLRVDNYLKQYSDKRILFVEISSNVYVMYNTIAKVYMKYIAPYKDKINKNNKTPKLIVNIDHTLLVEKLNESDLLELISNIGKLAIKLTKDFEAMVNIVGQLNNNIETVLRILKPELHYPQKSDIYAQGQIYNACDNVYVIHKPSMLKLEYYGTRKIPTAQLIHLIKLKARHGTIGNIWLQDNLKNGTIEERINEKDKKEQEENDDLDDIIEYS